MAMDSKRFIWGGRLADYQCYGMHQVIAAALKTVEIESGRLQ